VVFLGLFALLYWAYRNRVRLGGGQGSAQDPVCGMHVETATAPATAVHEGETVYFCSDGCRLRFVTAADGAAAANGRAPRH
jgi:YHS domain-containing protein